MTDHAAYPAPTPDPGHVHWSGLSDDAWTYQPPTIAETWTDAMVCRWCDLCGAELITRRDAETCPACTDIGGTP